MDQLSASPITLDQLEVLAAVAERGSFSAAARHLGRVQSAVSYTIATLERQLDLTLFDRSSKKPRLSPAGEAVLADARATLRSVAALRARARSLHSGTEPLVSLAVSVMLPRDQLVLAVSAFRRQFPDVRLVVHSEALGGVADLVLSGAANIGVSEPLPRATDALSERPLGSVEMVHVAAQTHPLSRERGPLSRRALEEHVQIVLSDRSRLTEGVDFGVLSGPTWRVADLGTKHAFLLAGFGWGGMPKHDVATDVQEKRLVRLKLEDRARLPTRVELYAVHRSDAAPGPAARWLLATLTRTCFEAGSR